MRSQGEIESGGEHVRIVGAEKDSLHSDRLEEAQRSPGLSVASLLDLQ